MHLPNNAQLFGGTSDTVKHGIELSEEVFHLWHSALVAMGPD